MSESPLDIGVALKFLRALGKNNDRGWFAEHRAVYDETIKPGWEDLVAALLAVGTSFDERLAHVDPKRCIFRLYRDTRFSNDKTPYKPGITAWMSPFGKAGSNPGFYLALEPGGKSMLAAGLYSPEKETLAEIRRHFAHDDVRPFERILAAKKMQPYLPLETDALTMMPRGFPKDHPRAALIRARRFTIRRGFTDRELIDGDAFALFRNAMRDCAPFVRYFERFADASASTRDLMDG